MKESGNLNSEGLASALGWSYFSENSSWYVMSSSAYTCQQSCSLVGRDYNDEASLEVNNDKDKCEDVLEELDKTGIHIVRKSGLAK